MQFGIINNIIANKSVTIISGHKLACDPLEQFDVLPTSEYLSSFIGGCCNIWGWGIDISNFYFWLNPLTLTFIISYLYLIGLRSLRYAIKQRNFKTRRISRFFYNAAVEFVSPLYLGKKAYLTFISFIFLSIFLKNIYSQLPLTKAATATLQLPFSYSITFFVGLNLLILLRRRRFLTYLGLFVPSASPAILKPLLWIVEILSHFVKIFSLAVRLCANIFSGHVLLDIIVTGLFLMLAKGGVAILAVFVMFQLLGFALILLETVIGFLQALVFIILTGIYISDTKH